VFAGPHSEPTAEVGLDELEGMPSLDHAEKKVRGLAEGETAGKDNTSLHPVEVEDSVAAGLPGLKSSGSNDASEPIIGSAFNSASPMPIEGLLQAHGNSGSQHTAGAANASLEAPLCSDGNSQPLLDFVGGAHSLGEADMPGATEEGPSLGLLREEPDVAGTGDAVTGPGTSPGGARDGPGLHVIADTGAAVSTVGLHPAVSSSGICDEELHKVPFFESRSAENGVDRKPGNGDNCQEEGTVCASSADQAAQALVQQVQVDGKGRSSCNHAEEGGLADSLCTNEDILDDAANVLAGDMGGGRSSGAPGAEGSHPTVGVQERSS
jgi:hypothetical protein